jgi:F-type H+-transporting ATPase subunit b
LAGKAEKMIEINQSLIFQIINLLLLMLILNALLYKPIRTILKNRAEKMAALEAEANKARADLIQKDQDYQNQLQLARKEGFEYKNQLKLAGQEEEKKVLQEAGQQVDAQLDQNRQKIVQQVEAARRKLSDEVSSFSQEIAQKILGRTI